MKKEEINTEHNGFLWGEKVSSPSRKLEVQMNKSLIKIENDEGNYVELVIENNKFVLKGDLDLDEAAKMFFDTVIKLAEENNIIERINIKSSHNKDTKK